MEKRLLTDAFQRSHHNDSTGQNDERLATDKQHNRISATVMRFVAGGLVLFGDPDEFFMRQQTAADVSAKFRLSMSSNCACRRIGKSSGANSNSAVHLSYPLGHGSFCSTVVMEQFG